MIAKKKGEIESLFLLRCDCVVNLFNQRNKLLGSFVFLPKNVFVCVVALCYSDNRKVPDALLPVHESTVTSHLPCGITVRTIDALQSNPSESGRKVFSQLLPLRFKFDTPLTLWHVVVPNSDERLI